MKKHSLKNPVILGAYNVWFYVLYFEYYFKILVNVQIHVLTIETKLIIVGETQYD